MDIGRRLQQLRLAQGVSIQQLAKTSGVSGPFISRLERGVITDLSVDRLAALAEALGVPIAYFFSEADAPTPPDPIAHLALHERQFVQDPDNRKWIRIAIGLKRLVEQEENKKEARD